MTEFNWLDISHVKPYQSLSKEESGLVKVLPQDSIQKITREDGSPREQNLTRDKFIKTYIPGETAHKSNSEFKAKDIMSSPVHSLESDVTLHRVFSFFEERNIEHIPVCDKGRPVAMVNYKQMLEQCRLRVKDMDAFLDQNVLTVARAPVLGVHEETSLRKLATIMLQEDFEALPILDSQYALKGIITRDDILKFVVFQMPYDILA